MGIQFKKKLKSAVCLALSLMMIAGLIQITSFTASADGNVVDIFDDVQEGQWYVNAVQFVYDRGIMIGTSANIFGVSNKLQREQFAQVLYSMAGKPAVAAEAENPFKDVPNNPGYPRDAILWAFSEGIVAGNGDGNFGVSQPIQRQAIAAMLYKYAQFYGYDLTVNETAIDGFADKDKVSAWAVNSIKWAVTQGIISGKTGNLLDPLGNGTRAECAQMIMKLIKINSEYGELPEVGAIVTLGKYEQDNNFENGKEAIEWQVLDLDKENNRAFVVSKYGLDEVDWNSNWNSDATWATCSLRNWCNNDFKNEAFSLAELNRIPTVTVSTGANLYFGTSGGEDSEDQIFCLNVEEMNKYLGPYALYSDDLMWGMNQNIICPLTEYAKIKGVWNYTFTEEDYYSNETNWYNPVTQTRDLQIYEVYTTDVIGVTGALWWLRTPGENSRRGCFVRSNGDGGYNCRKDTYTNHCAARPAMWIQY